MDKKRAIGLDMLKIISAIMIVVLHYNGYSDNLTINTCKSYNLFVVSNLMEAFCICGVNVFVIISCYISIRSLKTDIQYGIKRFLSVWMQTIVVTVPLAIILLIVGIAKIDVSDVLCSFFPFSTRAYWFITTFMCFNLLVPFLNKSVKALSSVSLLYIAAVLVMVYCVLPTFFELFGWKDVQHGYSLVWFVTLYYCTAFSVKSQWYKRVSAYLYVGGYLAVSLALFASVLVIGNIGPLSGYANYFTRNYASIPVFFQSFLLFFAFERIDSGGKHCNIKLFSLLASGSLMCYVIHMHPLLKQVYISADIGRLFPQSVFAYIICCTIASIGVFLVGVVAHQVLKKPVEKLTDCAVGQTERIKIKLYLLTHNKRRERQ